MGFIPGIKGRFHIQKSCSVTHYMNRCRKKMIHVIISIDVEKGFDISQHLFRMKILIKLGTEGRYLNIIKTI